MGTQTKAASKTLSLAEVGVLVRVKVDELGGPSAAGKHWSVTPQMVHLVTKAERRPTAAMLNDLRLEEIAAEIRYRPRKRR